MKKIMIAMLLVAVLFFLPLFAHAESPAVMEDFCFEENVFTGSTNYPGRLLRLTVYIEDGHYIKVFVPINEDGTFMLNMYPGNWTYITAAVVDTDDNGSAVYEVGELFP